MKSREHDPMHELVRTAKFERAYARYTRRDHQRRENVDRALAWLKDNPGNPRLKTHPLKGAGEGQLSCSCGYDCRIVFAVENLPGSKIDHIVLHDVGTHDEVY